MVNGVVIISPEGEIFSKDGLLLGGHGAVIAEYIEDKSLEEGVTPFSILKELIAEKYECRGKGQKGR